MIKVRVLDFETTGTEPPAEVIEVGSCDVFTEAGAALYVGKPVSRLCGCERPPTCETRAVHHIDPREVAGLERFDARAFVEQARADGVQAIAAHHADFEEKWIRDALDGMPMVCTYKGALRVMPDAPSHANQVLRYWLEEQGRTQLDHALATPAHRAGPDAYATAHLLRELLGHASLTDLIAWTKEPALMPRITIGKWRGYKWSDVDAGFLDWMCRQPTMEADLKWNARRELDRRAEDLRRLRR